MRENFRDCYRMSLLNPDAPGTLLEDQDAGCAGTARAITFVAKNRASSLPGG